MNELFFFSFEKKSHYHIMRPQVSCDNWNLMLLSLHTKPQKSTQQTVKIRKIIQI